MLVHISPKEEDLCETVCSLNFATRVRSVHLGKTDSTVSKCDNLFSIKPLDSLVTLGKERLNMTKYTFKS